MKVLPSLLAVRFLVFHTDLKSIFFGIFFRGGIFYFSLLTFFFSPGSSEFKIKGDTGTADASISLSEGGASLSFDIDNHWTIYELAEEVLGKGPADLINDLETKVALKIGFSLSTNSGITFSAMGNVTGKLAQDIKHVSYWWDHPGNSFAIAVSLPIFSSDPTAITLALSVTDPYIQLSKHLWFDCTYFLPSGSISFLSPFTLHPSPPVRL